MTALSNTDLAAVTLQAEPEPLQLDLRRTAALIIDMQNAFVSKGGNFDLRGIDVSGFQKVITPIKTITGAVRAKQCKIIYTAHVYAPDLSDGGGPSSANWHKSPSLVAYLTHPEWRDKCLFRGTWGADIINELKPEDGDIVVDKARYSAFYGTSLSLILRTYNIKYLLFTGVATNVCVESTIRDAYYQDYFPILISDATSNTGPSYVQEATIFNVKNLFGWVTTTASILKALQ